MPDRGSPSVPEPENAADPQTFRADLVITATAYATHPEGAVVPTSADASPQE